MSAAFDRQSRLRAIAVHMLSVYGIDGNSVLQSSINEDGYTVLLDGPALAAMDMYELATAVFETGTIPNQRRQWPEEFPVQQFLEIYNDIVS